MERKVGQNRQPSSVFESILYRYLLSVLFPIQIKLDSERSSFFSESYARQMKKLVNWRRDWFACTSAVVPCHFAALPSCLLWTDLK